MQDCFRQHPDVYGAELEDDENEPRPGDAASPVTLEPSGSEGSSPPSLADMDSPDVKAEKVSGSTPDRPEVVQGKRERAQAATQQVAAEHGITSESSEMVPKAWHDSTADSSKGEK